MSQERVKIYTREQAEAIDPAAWDALADRSRSTNPFYERWNLLPALRYLEPDTVVYVVTVYRGGELVALFPVSVGHFLFLRYLKIWCHRDVPVTDVLSHPALDLAPVFQKVLSQLRGVLLISQKHMFARIQSEHDGVVAYSRRTRRAVVRNISWEGHQAELTGKDRREHKRIVRRALQREGIVYRTSDTEQGVDWFGKYLDVERGSWKAHSGRTLYASSPRFAYFKELVALGEQQRKVKFQGLFKDEEPIAMSFRFTCGQSAYEIKTSYKERFQRLYPGVVLELLNMRSLLSDPDLVFADSCSQRNAVVERVWPDQVVIQKSFVFAESWVGRFSRRFCSISVPWSPHRALESEALPEKPRAAFAIKRTETVESAEVDLRFRH